MKKYALIIITLLVAIYLPKVNAVTKSYVTITDTRVQYRSGAGTDKTILGKVTTGENYYLVTETLFEDTLKNNTCNGGWYQIQVNDTEQGYVCSECVKATIVKDEPTLPPVTPPVEEGNLTCEESLAKKGFPSDYIGSLCALKAKHPAWRFEVLNTDLDWSTSVSKEAACGKSYIASSKAEDVDSTCKNAYTKTWYPASQKAVAYYLDPRNFLNEKEIFMFNTNKYEESLKDSYPALSKNTIGGTDFYSYHLGIGNDLAQIISEAGYNTGISPIFLSSRITQELGSGTSERELYSGVYAGYEGYYNFFNIGVSDSCATTKGVAVCGLSTAKNRGWTSPLIAITGGANEVGESYINKGQYTTYLQKYNLTPTNKSSLYTHQYMTNVAAPSSEAKTAYNTYNKLGVLDAAFVFYIPVFKNMGMNIDNGGNGASGEDANSDKTTISTSTIVTSAGYRYSTSVISQINPGTLAADVKGNLEGVAGAGNIKIYNQNGVETSSGKIGTGFKIGITNQTTTSTLTVIVKGDTSGDGEVNALDLLQIQKNILGNYSLDGAYQNAGDTSGDGVVNALDLLQVQKSILGTYSITQ